MSETIKQFQSEGEAQDDFEEAFRVIKIDDTHWIGAHPLRLPLRGARGVYGGHICAQTLLVALESSPGFVMHSMHTYFVRPGKSTVPCQFEVETLSETKNYVRKQIKVTQIVRKQNKIIYTCIASLVRPESFKSFRFQRDIPTDLVKKYPNPDKLTVVKHTGWVKNAYPEEFADYKKSPHESLQPPSERWISLYGGINNHGSNASFKDPKFNFVALGCLSDSALLSTMARVLHLPWNPTELFNQDEFDADKDAQLLMGISLNIVQLFHYDAMSLDHHIYFHCADYNLFDMVKEWLCWAYQMKVLSNGRTMVRGHYYKPDGQCIATIVQEGVTEFHGPIAEKL